MKDRILDLIHLLGGSASEEEIWRHFPNQRQEIVQALRELFLEGLIYPTITDFGKYEQNWNLKKVEPGPGA